MHKSAKPVLVALFLTLALSGCHHNVTTAKVPQTPPIPPSPSAVAPEVKPSTPPTVAVTAKTPELTNDQLFAQNVRDIFFSYDNADVQAAEQSTVSADASFLASHPAMTVLIEGHCDERGSDEYNLSLGESRAARIRNALINGGVSADRIKVISFGKERPFCSSAENDGCWQQNRRAHFVLQASK